MNTIEIPVLLLTGYLGSGKTTLVNHILSNKRGIKFAVIVNDIGEVNIDADLIQKGGVVGKKDDSLVALQNGCICCTLKTDLIEQMFEIMKMQRFDYIVIEASGICEPEPIAQTLCSIPHMGGAYTKYGICRLDCITTVVDALRLQSEFSCGDDLTRKGIDEEDIENLIIQQIEFCNIILLNKAAEVQPEELKRIRQIIHTLQPGAQIIECNYADVDLDKIIHTHLFNFERAATSAGWIRGIEQQVSEEEEKEAKEKNEKKESLVMGLVMLLAIVLAVGIFVIVPFLISEALKRPVPSPQLRGLIEGVIRVALFVAYVKLISCMEDIKRVFMYHGAEHKSINCVENGKELTVENVRMQTTVHKRCGTSFLLIVMFVSILFFMFIVVGNVWLRMVLRILLIPVIAGLSYEFIRYAGEHDNKVINVLSKPGLMLQSLTTKEPDDSMIAVAIAAVEAVFDWKAFLEEEKTENEEEPVEEVKEKVEDEIEILSIDDEDDEEKDEILNALDRYFEAPEPSDEEKKESDT